MRGWIKYHPPTDEQKRQIADLYVVLGKSTTDIAKEFGVNISCARRMILDSGIAMRTRAQGIALAGEKISEKGRGRVVAFTDSWRKNISIGRRDWAKTNARGVSLKPSGYMEITTGENKFRGEHVVVMERHIGRRLGPDEVVHHVDHDKTNNDISNLEVMSASDHSRLHALKNLPKRTRKSNGQFE